LSLGFISSYFLNNVFSVKVRVIVSIWHSLAHFYSVNILFCLKVSL
jgi:hypothetical protein